MRWAALTASWVSAPNTPSIAPLNTPIAWSRVCKPFTADPRIPTRRVGKSPEVAVDASVGCVPAWVPVWTGAGEADGLAVVAAGALTAGAGAGTLTAGAAGALTAGLAAGRLGEGITAGAGEGVAAGSLDGLGKAALPDGARVELVGDVGGGVTAGAGEGAGEGVAAGVTGVVKDGKVEALAGLVGEELPLGTGLGTGLAAGLGAGLAAGLGAGLGVGLAAGLGAGLTAGAAASATGEGGSRRTQVSLPATPSACRPADRWKAATALAVLS